MKLISFLYLTILLLSFAFLITNCSEESTSQPPPAVDNTNNGFESFEVAKIFAENCIESGCHGGSEPVHSLSLESWSKMILGSWGRPLSDSLGDKHSAFLHDDGIYGGEVIIPYNAERSLLYRLIAGDVVDSTFQMPSNKPNLNESEINTIKDWINNGAKSFNGEIPYSTSTGEIFICNQSGDEVTVIDLHSKLVKRTIDVNLNPVAIDLPDHVVRKDGYIYVGLVSAGKILKIDINTFQIVGTISGLEFPGMIVFSSDGKKLFASKSPLSPGTLTGVYEIEIQTMNLLSEIHLPISGVPHGMAITPDDKLLITDMRWDVIYIYNTLTHDFENDPIVMSPGQMTIHEPMHAYTSPDGLYLYVSCRASNFVIIYDVQSRQEVARLDMGNHPMQMAITQDGSKIYVTIFHESKIKIIRKNGNSWSIEDEISHPAFEMLWGIDITPDEKYIVATSSNQMNSYKPRYKQKDKLRISNVIFIDALTNEVVRVLDVERYASGVNAR